MAKRRCHAITKSGKACRAAPRKESDHCLAHTDRKERDATGFGVNGGRPPKPRVVDVLKERIEQEIDEWLAPLTEARDAMRAVVVGNGPTAHVEEVPDIPTRIAAVREVLDRSYGRPKQATEITGAEGGPIKTTGAIDLDTLSTEEVREYRRLRAKALRAVA